MFKKIVFIKLVLFTFSLNAAFVEVVSLKKAQVNPLQEFVGTLNFSQKSFLSSQNQGFIKKVNFEIGDKVKKGKVLVDLDRESLDAKIKEAKANLDNAKINLKNSLKNYERYEKLLKKKSITQKEYDDSFTKSNYSKNQVKVLQAKLEQLQIQSKKMKIKAAFDGTIIEKNINLAQWLKQGQIIAKLVDTKQVEFIFNIPFEIVNALNIGDIYEVSISNKKVKAKLSAIIPSGDRLTRTFPVKFKANINEGFVFEGQEVKVKLSKNIKKQAFILPRDAVIEKFGKDVIFIVNDKNIVSMVAVKIIAYLEKNIAIESLALKEGMKIVSKGNERIFPNTSVKIINDKKE